MAKSDIELELKTKYKGDGVTKLKQGVKEVDSVVKKASGAVNNLTSQLGGMDNAAGKAASAMSGLVQSFAQGGIWGAAAAGAMMLVNAIVDGFKKAKEEAKKAAEEARDAFMKSIETIKDKASNIMVKLSYSTQRDDALSQQVKEAFGNAIDEDIEKIKKQFQRQRQGMTDSEQIEKSRKDEELAIKQLQRDKLIGNADEDLKSQQNKTRGLRRQSQALVNNEFDLGVKNEAAKKNVDNINDQISKKQKQLKQAEVDYQNQVRYSTSPEAASGMAIAYSMKVSSITSDIEELKEQLKEAVKVQDKANKAYEEAKFDRQKKDDEVTDSATKEKRLQERLQILKDDNLYQQNEQKIKEEEEKRKKETKTREGFEKLSTQERREAVREQIAAFDKTSNPGEIKQVQEVVQQNLANSQTAYDEAKKSGNLDASVKAKEELDFWKQQREAIKRALEAQEQNAKLESEKKKHLQEQKTALERQKKAIEDQAKNDEDNRKAAEDIKNLREAQAKLIKENNTLIAAGGGQNGWNGGDRGGTWGDYLHAKRGQDRAGSKQMNRDINNVMRGGQGAADIIASNMTDEQRAKYQEELRKYANVDEDGNVTGLKRGRAASKFEKDRVEALQKLLGADKAGQLKQKEKDAEEQKRKQNEQKRTEYLKTIAEKIQDLGVI